MRQSSLKCVAWVPHITKYARLAQSTKQVIKEKLAWRSEKGRQRVEELPSQGSGNFSFYIRRGFVSR